MWDWFWQAATAAATWLAGETGSRMVAGAAGGLMRWGGQAQRRLLDGVLAVLSGSVAALYLAPVVVAVMRVMQVDIGDDAAGQRTAGFIAGLMGMSLAKVVIAMIETWAAQRQGGDTPRGDDNDRS